MGRRGTLLMMIFLLLGCACAEKAVDITYRFGSREEQKIAVTIDDCYHAEDVRAVLDILQANDVRATFFPIGKALKYEDAALWQEVVASGCEIGNHSWGHTYLTKLSRQKIKFQMLRTQEKWMRYWTAIIPCRSCARRWAKRIRRWRKVSRRLVIWRLSSGM